MLFELFLFGPFKVVGPDGADLTPKSRKARAILAMLAVAPRGSRSRVWLRDKLWSDRGEDQASASLRQALLDIRKALGDAAGAAVIADKHTVSLDLCAIRVDALEALSADDGAGRIGLDEHFLEGIDVRDAEFEEWLTLERQSWHARLEDAGYSHELDPRAAPRPDQRATLGLPRTAAAAPVSPERAAVPNQSPNPAAADPAQGADGLKLWRVALLPPVVLGSDAAAHTVQSEVQRGLVTAFLDTGDLRIVDLAPLPVSGLLGGSLARLPEQVNLSTQVRVFADPAVVRVAIVLQNPLDNALVWADEVIVERREIAAGSFAQALIARATEEALRHFLRHGGHEAAEAEGRIASAVASMFRLTRGDLDRSEAILRRHIAQAPTAQGHAWLAFLNTFRVGQRFRPQDAALIEETQHLARKAVEMEPANALVNALVGHVHSYLFGEFDRAAGLFEQSLRVNPSQTLAWDLYAMLHAYAGQPRRALAMARWARHLGAFSPHRYYFETTRAITGNFSGEHRTAIEAGEAALAERPDFNSLLRVLVSSHAHLDRPDEARVFLDRLLEVEPNFSIASLREAGYPGLETEGGRHFLDGLTRAGVRKH
jgi:tetratricopeptide (TPR) repeat protein